HLPPAGTAAAVHHPQPLPHLGAPGAEEMPVGVLLDAHLVAPPAFGIDEQGDHDRLTWKAIQSPACRRPTSAKPRLCMRASTWPPRSARIPERIAPPSGASRRT